MSELPRSAPGAHPSVRVRYIGTIAPAHVRPLRAASRAHRRYRPTAGPTSASRAITFGPVHGADVPPAPDTAAEPWPPPIMKQRPTHARDGWAA